MAEESHSASNEYLYSSARSYFSNLIDYAGLFPPAQLPLEQAIQNYAVYQTCKDAWMLGHFVIPVSRLAELDPYVSLFTKKRPLCISAIGQRSVDSKNCLELLASDLELIRSFCNRHGEAVNVNVFELPLPPIHLTRQLLEGISKATTKNSLQVFCEVTVPFNETWKQQMLLTLNEIAIHNHKSAAQLGLKLRTGGLTANAFPIPHQVATVHQACTERAIPQKFTAGLHHPIRMYREEVKTKMHGFLNVFTAGMLARTKKIDFETIIEILSDEAAEHFIFTDEGICWKNHLVTIKEIEQLRETALYSFGSCSFDEPREELRALQILLG
ncbi:hypothetical protein [Alkalihalobacterium elongatum]|uniref:hypothetical protein n=1 Tax=Alkalihalobacterium elongatum TaxID=2675466 RepID=UPI001C1F39AD|nr:hypothetical protein [Alkalihalobacterium elongatum]